MKTKQSLPSYELDLYRKIYDDEITYRNNFSDRAYKTITVIISLIGAVVWLITQWIKIYQNQCCYFQVVNILILLGIIILTSLIVIGFFKVLYNYEDTRQKPEDIKQALEEYKTLNNVDDNVIYIMNESLKVSYIDAAIRNNNETRKHIALFKKVYKWIIVDVILIAVCFFLEIIF